MLMFRRTNEFDILDYSDSDYAEEGFVAYFEATSHGVWLRSFIYGISLLNSISRPLRILCDNTAAVFLGKNNKSGSRNKHIDIKYLVLREYIK